LGERPGYWENKVSRVLVGKTGQELDETYLPLAGLRRRDVRCVNVVSCFADNNKTPTAKEVLSCAAHHIPQEIEDTKPEVVILMGGSACTLCPGIRLDMMHGIPQHTDKVGALFGWRGWVVPMYHPALGLHESRWMTSLLDDWAGLQGELEHPGDAPITEPRYSKWTKRHSWLSMPLLGIDTEDHGGVPFSVQVSGLPGSGMMLMADDQDAMDCLRWMLPLEHEIVLHNAAHDIEVLRRLGVRIPPYRDTMQEAFQLGNLPQGLKALAYRLFRTTMVSWGETVRPASINALLLWLAEAMLVARMDLFAAKTKVFKTCVCGHSEKAHWTVSHVAKCPCSDYTPREEREEVRGAAEALFARLSNHIDEGDEYDAWLRLREWRDENDHDYAHVVARVGPWPILGIKNCSEAQAIRYAVGDADATLQVAVELERRRRERRFEIAPGDEDQ
jgi:uracil-DNA glycosylase family 4